MFIMKYCPSGHMLFSVIKAHGGKLNVETRAAGQAGKEGVGAEFIILLPV
jgi:signal transduction histidine kinase